MSASLPAVPPSFVDRDPGVRVAVVAQFVERQLVGGDHLLPIARLPDLQRNRLLHRAEVFRGDDLEAVEVHTGGRMGSPSAIVSVTSTSSCLLFSFTSNAVTRASG